MKKGEKWRKERNEGRKEMKEGKNEGSYREVGSEGNIK